MRRFCALWLMTLGSVGSAPAEAAAQGPLDGGTNGNTPGFHLEGRPAIDDVFGDAADYRRTIDRFLELTLQMQAMRDEFARSVQTTLNELGVRGADKKSASRFRHSCPLDTVAGPYAKAHHLGVEYLRIGRELTRHYDQIKEFDRLGESVGLTPDYRWKVKRVLVQYGALLTDYREMKVAFHDQLIDELRYLGCDLTLLVIRGDPGSKQAASLIDESWPQPGQPGAPGVPLPKSAEAKNDRETPPPSLPSEKLPPPQPITLPKRTAPADPGAHEARSGVLFYVDNTRCQRGAVVFVDGKKLGEVPAATRVGFQAPAGPHDLCLLDGSKKE
jgi:hypothetical protein